jgi:hypothetical protein
VQYRLPRTPIKEKEKRAANFEAQFGSGGTELDALEALHPGVLRQILVEHIERYYDHDLAQKVENAVARFRDELDNAASEVRDIHSDQIAALDEQRNAIARAFEQVHRPAQAAYNQAIMIAWEAYRAAIEPARDEIMDMQQRYIDEAQPLIREMNADLAQFAPDPELFDWPEPAEVDEGAFDPLYDSTRSYVEQVDRFRKHQGKDADVRRACDRIVQRICTVCGKPFETPSSTRRTVHPECSNKRGYAQRLERKRCAKKGLVGQ